MSLKSAIKGIFSGPKVVEDVFDKDNGILVRAGGWLNDLHHTTAEAVADRKELIAAALEFYRATLDENTVRSKTRRMVAVGWLQLETFLILLAAVMRPYDKELGEFYRDMAFSGMMAATTVAVIGFFFGTHMLRARGSLPPVEKK